jgi:hypothetical protein
VLVLAACSGSPAASDSPATEVASASATESAVAAATPTPVPSASEGNDDGCLTADVMAAFDELRDGELDTDPPRTEVADAFDNLPLEGTAAEARDAFVRALRADPPVEMSIVLEANNLLAQVALPEC